MRVASTILLSLTAGTIFVARPAWALPSSSPIVAGFNSQSLGRGDDCVSGAVSLGFDANFFGNSYSSLYVNNNGNVTFGASLAKYTAFDLSSTHSAIIAPFFADVDTRGAASGVTTYGTGLFDGRQAFGVNWNNVGYYGYGTDKLNDFQLILVDRSDIAAGDFDIYFNYGQIQWEAGNASGGKKGLGGLTARAGFSNGDPALCYQMDGSAEKGAFLDGGASSLTAGSNVGEAGRYVFTVRNGVFSVPDAGGTLALFALGLGGLIFAHRKLRVQLA